MISDFTDLHAWKESHKLVLQIYKITKSFPKYEQYALADQMRRASISITSNIAEGYGRNSYKEKVQFFYLAQGSLIELKNQIIVAKDVDYINHQTYYLIFDQSNLAHKLLQGLISKSKSFVK